MKNKSILLAGLVGSLCIGLTGCETGVDYAENNNSEYSYTAHNSYTGDQTFAANQHIEKQQKTSKIAYQEKQQQEKQEKQEKSAENNNNYNYADENTNKNNNKNNHENIAEKSTLLFESGKTHISAAQRKILIQQASFLKNNPDATIRIEGHADQKGKVALNKALSLKRAEAAAKFLKQQGIDAKRIEITAHAADAPHAFGADKKAMVQNRRVVLTIIPGNS